MISSAARSLSACTRTVAFGRFGGATTRLGGEIERDAKHVGIFDVEQTFLVQIVGLAPQSTTDDLLAQKLGAEGAHAENVGDRVRVPSFGEHGYRYDAADAFAEAPFPADGVHHLTQQI